jgi:hypothetical protein
MARYLRDDPKLSWSGVLKLMRQEEIGRHASRWATAAPGRRSSSRNRPATGSRPRKEGHDVSLMVRYKAGV